MMGGVGEGRPPVVAVWRKHWLPRSETFIQNQIVSLTRWSSFHMARDQREGLPVRLDYVVPPRSRWDARWERWFGTGRHLRTFASIVHQHRVQVIHAHFGVDAWDILPYARAAHLPLVVTFHGYDVTRNLSPDVREAAKLRLRLQEVFAGATVLIAVSEFIAGRLRFLGAPEAKIVVHSIGIPHGPEVPSAGPRRGVCFVGRFVPKKGVDDLLRAYAGLSDAVRSEHPLSLVGAGDEEPHLRSLATQLGLSPLWLGWQTPEQVSELLTRAALFCGPSKTAPDGDAEGLGMVFLEAQSRATPVVSYRHGGIAEAVRDGVTGLLAEEGDVEGLTKALERVLTSPDLASSFGKAGACWVRTSHDVGQQTKRLEEVYDRVSREWKL